MRLAWSALLGQKLIKLTSGIGNGKTPASASTTPPPRRMTGHQLRAEVVSFGIRLSGLSAPVHYEK